MALKRGLDEWGRDPKQRSCGAGWRWEGATVGKAWALLGSSVSGGMGAKPARRCVSCDRAGRPSRRCHRRRDRNTEAQGAGRQLVVPRSGIGMRTSRRVCASIILLTPSTGEARGGRPEAAGTPGPRSWSSQALPTEGTPQRQECVRAEEAAVSRHYSKS